MNPDLSITPTFEATRAAYAALSGAQTHRPNAQVMGFAVAFLVTCEELGLTPSEVLNKASRLAREADVHYAPQVRALREYVRNELKGR